ncbi:hypothetical protein PJ311_18915, partial [Bacillus sp. CLL-7-23]|nr:hypothetical protein [Bacillus changyiensis]
PLVPQMQVAGIPINVFSFEGLQKAAIQFIKKVEDAYNGAKGGKAHSGHGIKKTPKGGHGGEPKVPHKSKPHEPVHKVDKPHQSTKDAGTVSGKHPHEASKPKKHEPTKKVEKEVESKKDVQDTGKSIKKLDKLSPTDLNKMSLDELKESLPDDWSFNANGPNGNDFVHIKDRNGQYRIRIDPPDRVTKYDHMHIYDESGNSLDINGKIVEYDAPAAHIPYKR